MLTSLTMTSNIRLLCWLNLAARNLITRSASDNTLELAQRSKPVTAKDYSCHPFSFKMSASEAGSGSERRCSTEHPTTDGVNRADRCLNEMSERKIPKKRIKRPKPNYFVAIPILNRQLKERLTSLQQSLLESNSDLERMLVKPETFHFTLMVFNLDDTVDEHVHRAKLALAECLNKVKAELYLGVPDLRVPIGSLDHFDKRVLYAKPRDPAAFDRLVKASDQVKAVFERYGLPSTDQRVSKPHITLFKPKGPRMRTVWGTFENVIDENKNEEFGVETLEALQICMMSAEKQDDGYYKVLDERNLADDDSESISLISSNLAVDPPGKKKEEHCEFNESSGNGGSFLSDLLDSFGDDGGDGGGD